MSTGTTTVGIVGASGYGGAELLRLCAQHPVLSVVWPRPGRRPAGRWPTTPLAGRRLPRPWSTGQPRRSWTGWTWSSSPFPTASPRTWSPTSRPGGGRRRPGRRLPTGRPGALPDLVRRGAPRPGPARHLRLRAARAPPGRAAGARRVAAPGCYPTAALALALVRPAGRCAGALSRQLPTGGPPSSSTRPAGLRGRTGGEAEHLQFAAVDEDFVAYGLLDHRHTPRWSRPSAAGPVHAPPGPDGPGHSGHLLRPSGRRPAPAHHGDAMEILRDRYDDEPFVVVTDGPPSTKATSGSNTAHLSVRVDPRTGWVGGAVRPGQPGQGSGGPGRAVRQPGARTARGAGLPMAGVYP